MYKAVTEAVWIAFLDAVTNMLDAGDCTVSLKQLTAHCTDPLYVFLHDLLLLLVLLEGSSPVKPCDSADKAYRDAILFRDISIESLLYVCSVSNLY